MSSNFLRSKVRKGGGIPAALYGNAFVGAPDGSARYQENLSSWCRYHGQTCGDKFLFAHLGGGVHIPFLASLRFLFSDPAMQPGVINQVYPRLFQTLHFTDAKETRLALVLIFRFLRFFTKPQQENITKNISAMSAQPLKL